MIYMEYQVLFSLKYNEKVFMNVVCSVVIGALRVKGKNSLLYDVMAFLLPSTTKPFQNGSTLEEKNFHLHRRLLFLKSSQKETNSLKEIISQID